MRIIRHSLVISAFARGIGVALKCTDFAHSVSFSSICLSCRKESFHQIIPHSVDASFPSDHGSGSFAFAAASLREKHQSRLVVHLLFLRIVVAILSCVCRCSFANGYHPKFYCREISLRESYRKFHRRYYPVNNFSFKNL